MEESRAQIRLIDILITTTLAALLFIWCRITFADRMIGLPGPLGIASMLTALVAALPTSSELEGNPNARNWIFLASALATFELIVTAVMHSGQFNASQLETAGTTGGYAEVLEAMIAKITLPVLSIFSIGYLVNITHAARNQRPLLPACLCVMLIIAAVLWLFGKSFFG